LAEIQHAVSSGVPYQICRLYNVKDAGATFRVAPNIAPRLASIIEVLRAMPIGVKVDSLRFDPSFFDFGTHETTIEYSDEAE
jgi:hypothetical protein